MEFCLSEAQESCRRSVARLLEDRCPIDRARALYDSETTLDYALWKDLADLGLLGAAVPEDRGGSGFDLLTLAVAGECLGRVAAPVALEAHHLAAMAISAGPDDVAESWAPMLARGEAIGTVAIGEGTGNWAPQTWTTECRNGRMLGRKQLVPMADHADVFVVGLRGGSLASVEAKSLLHRPVRQRTLDRSRALFEVDFTGARGTEIGAPSHGRAIFDAGLVLLAADAFGAASRLIEMCSDYALHRVQFGQPIGQFQAVKHQLAEMALAVLTSRGLWWYAAHAKDALPEAFPRAASLAKSHITERCVEVARQAVEIHGGIGYTWECDLHLLLKRTLADQILFGSPAAHRERCAELGGWT